MFVYSYVPMKNWTRTAGGLLAGVAWMERRNDVSAHRSAENIQNISICCRVITCYLSCCWSRRRRRRRRLRLQVVTGRAVCLSAWRCLHMQCNRNLSFAHAAVCIFYVCVNFLMHTGSLRHQIHNISENLSPSKHDRQSKSNQIETISNSIAFSVGL